MTDMVNSTLQNQDTYNLLVQTQRQRVQDGVTVSLLSGCETARRVLVLVLPQLGDFDSLEYAWWIRRESETLDRKGIQICAVGIGDRASGQKFCDYTGFSPATLFVDPTAALHRQLGLYEGLSVKLPGLSSGQRAWVNLMLMCAGIGSPGTLAEVLRGYVGDRQAPQLIGENEVVQTGVLPPMKGSFFNLAGGTGFQRPFELATLRLRNMAEVLRHWKTYVPNAAYLTQRGGTFLFDRDGQLLYEHRDRGILDFAEQKSRPLAFLEALAE
jgi:hypothetical protein